MIHCYRCQQALGERNKKVKVKQGMVTTTYCKHCYGAITRGLSVVKTN